MSDEGGEVVCEYVYDAFGNLVSSSGSISQPYEFVGREGYYREGDLYLLGQRWYNSNVGRFISRDPILSPIHAEQKVNWDVLLYSFAEIQSLPPCSYICAPLGVFAPPSGVICGVLIGYPLGKGCECVCAKLFPL
jgi:RHS repeat-associated protein